MIVKYDEYKTIDENTNLILTGMANYNFSLLDEQELVTLADSLFKLFKGNFENSNYSVMEEVSNYCKAVVESCVNRKLYTDVYCGETIIDIACFVFEQMYMYKDKVLCLKAIIHSNGVDKTLKIRALEEILCPEPEVQSLISNEVEEFSLMLQQLTN
ncbi:MAG: hypothetical protein II359_01695 [Clostridia bacterium]|nr:hypothetical protein [Clostridia bacterium]